MKIIINNILKSVLLLLFLSCAVCCSTTAQLTDAAKKGDMITVKGFVDNGADVDKAGKGGVTALAYAASEGHRDIIKLLVDKGADVDLALESCPRFKQPYQARCKKLLSEYKAEKNQLQPTKPVAIEASREAVKGIKSDVDELPTLNTKLNKNAYAIVIGIEYYRQKLPKADYAVDDANIITAYLTKTMGYPEENVITLLNDRALKSDMEKYFDRWLSNNVEENGRVFIYYSGHGAPNTKTGDAYLVPYDGDPAFITETGYPVARLYESLSKLKAKEIIVVIDSCFSGGGGRSVLAKGAKPLVMAINMPTSRKNMTVLTASSGDQISSAYEEKGHGLFTYFMLKGIKDENMIQPDGSIKMEDLFAYVKPQVERIARKQFNNEQTPQLIVPKKN